MKAVFSTSTSVTLGDHPVPAPAEHEILIKNVYVASNPKDWKLHDPKVYGGKDLIDGNDVAGFVHAVGPNVTRFAVGDRVAGFSKMMTDDKYGAYGEYTVVPETTTFRVPDSFGLDAAATIPLAAMTAALGLFLDLGLPTPDAPNDGSIAVLVNGASSSVGSFAVQLAKLAGLYVVATAGAAADVAKENGADVVIDYRGKGAEALSAELHAAGTANGRTFERALDAISENGTAVMCAAAIGKGKLSLVLSEDAKKVTNGVEASWTGVGRAHAEQAAFAQLYYDKISSWIAAGKFRGNRVELLPNGLASVEAGLARLKANKVSGAKLVYKISETPGVV